MQYKHITICFKTLSNCPLLFIFCPQCESNSIKTTDVEHMTYIFVEIEKHIMDKLLLGVQNICGVHHHQSALVFFYNYVSYSDL